ncbi:MAG: hypothetical protein L6Q76_17205 [Polyangiaceae bacterium]|nr:hypothetical protein [Polyangiaceae bacterium]
MNSIDDPNETTKKLAETTEAEQTGKPSAQGDLLAEIEENDARVIADLPRAERAAFKREMMSSLRRAAWAAGRLADLALGEEEPEPPTERDDEPPSGAQIATPLPPPFAVASNGQLLLNVDTCPELKLEGRTIFRAIELSDEEAAYALRKFEDVIHDVAGHLGGMIKRCEPGDGSGNDGDR